MMEIIIKSLDVNSVDSFVCQDSDLYARIIRPESEIDPTVDLMIQIRTVAVDAEHIIIEFPNGSVFAVNIPSFHYHMIEVM